MNFFNNKSIFYTNYLLHVSLIAHQIKDITDNIIHIKKNAVKPTLNIEITDVTTISMLKVTVPKIIVPIIAVNKQAPILHIHFSKLLYLHKTFDANNIPTSITIAIAVATNATTEKLNTLAIKPLENTIPVTTPSIILINTSTMQLVLQVFLHE